ncbi:hypothetical protein LTR09_011115 [Extremus antarcticus]|uniref:Uncharacterized protein n=1 Tax=Extremus antarcticus TaxID=702011 RepID=A0AAJ0G4N8_9PEZI|nr:hypothetical protein LTR09_011115 [Extremus antarcticus]
MEIQSALLAISTSVPLLCGDEGGVCLNEDQPHRAIIDRSDAKTILHEVLEKARDVAKSIAATLEEVATVEARSKLFRLPNMDDDDDGYDKEDEDEAGEVDKNGQRPSKLLIKEKFHLAIKETFDSSHVTTNGTCWGGKTRRD